MANKKRKTKVDERPWVDKDDIVIYDGTKESVDKIHLKAKKLGGSVGEVKYSPALKCLRSFKLYIDVDDDVYYIVINKTVLVFTDTTILLYSTEEEAREAVRVRTGRPKVTVIIERDDKVVEYLVPSAYAVEMEDSSPYGFPEALHFWISRPVKDEKGASYYTIDRNINPDWTYKKWLRGEYNNV